jgi:hypothetical protein
MAAAQHKVSRRALLGAAFALPALPRHPGFAGPELDSGIPGSILTFSRARDELDPGSSPG